MDLYISNVNEWWTMTQGDYKQLCASHGRAILPDRSVDVRPEEEVSSNDYDAIVSALSQFSDFIEASQKKGTQNVIYPIQDSIWKSYKAVVQRYLGLCMQAPASKLSIKSPGDRVFFRTKIVPGYPITLDATSVVAPIGDGRHRLMTLMPIVSEDAKVPVYTRYIDKYPAAHVTELNRVRGNLLPGVQQRCPGYVNRLLSILVI